MTIIKNDLNRSFGYWYWSDMQPMPEVVADIGLKVKLRTQVLIVNRPGLRDKMQQIGIKVLATQEAN